MAEAFRLYKERHGLEVRNSEEFSGAQRQLPQFVVSVGREIEQRMLAEIGKSYEGPRIEKNGKESRFVGYRASGGRVCSDR